MAGANNEYIYRFVGHISSDIEVCSMRTERPTVQECLLFSCVPGSAISLRRSGSTGYQNNPISGGCFPAATAAALQACELMVAVRTSLCATLIKRVNGSVGGCSFIQLRNHGLITWSACQFPVWANEIPNRRFASASSFSRPAVYNCCRSRG